MIQTIISNNCAGGAILHDLRMEFKTPTINLQILPEQYAILCRSLPYYLKSQLTEAKNFTPFEETMLRKMFGGVPDMPIGLLDGFILVCFQHFIRRKSFKTNHLTIYYNVQRLFSILYIYSHLVIFVISASHASSSVLHVLAY